MKVIFSLIIILGSFQSIKSQDLKLTSSTEQSWAGGVCCATGTNYQIIIEVESPDKKIHLDTLWIGQSLFVLNENDGYMVTCAKNGQRLSYTINVGISSNRYGDYEIEKKEESKKVKEKAPEYSGAALLIYHVNKQRKLLQIQAFKELPYLAYP